MTVRPGVAMLLALWGTGCPPRGECTSAADCVADSTCVGGVCARQCNSHVDCALSETCADGVCRPGPRITADGGTPATPSAGSSAAGQSSSRDGVPSSSSAAPSNSAVSATTTSSASSRASSAAEAASSSSSLSAPSSSAASSGPGDAGVSSSSGAGSTSGSLSGPSDAGVPDGCTVVNAHLDDDGDKVTVPVSLCLTGSLPPPYLAAAAPAPGVAVPGNVRDTPGGATRWTADDKAARPDGVPAICPTPATSCRPLEADFFNLVLPVPEPLAAVEARILVRTKPTPVPMRITARLGNGLQTLSSRSITVTVGPDYAWQVVGGRGQWPWPDGGFFPMNVGTMELAFFLDGFPDGGAGDIEVDGLEAWLHPWAGAPDCNDQDPARFYATSLYSDVDGDGYGDPDAGAPACLGWPLPPGTSIRGTDCRDDVAAAHPGAAFQSNPLPDGGGWDFNCDTLTNVASRMEDTACAFNDAGACVATASSFTPAASACGQTLPAGACDLATCTLSSSGVLVRCR